MRGRPWVSLWSPNPEPDDAEAHDVETQNIPKKTSWLFHWNRLRSFPGYLKWRSTLFVSEDSSK
jgi:hypothetical protein